MTTWWIAELSDVVKLQDPQLMSLSLPCPACHARLKELRIDIEGVKWGSGRKVIEFRARRENKILKPHLLELKF